jgi:hypothetical protein
VNQARDIIALSAIFTRGSLACCSAKCQNDQTDAADVPGGGGQSAAPWSKSPSFRPLLTEEIATTTLYADVALAGNIHSNPRLMILPLQGCIMPAPAELP